MNDQAIMENLLLTTKGVCDLYMHGTVESSTQNVHHDKGETPPMKMIVSHRHSSSSEQPSSHINLTPSISITQSQIESQFLSTILNFTPG